MIDDGKTTKVQCVAAFANTGFAAANIELVRYYARLRVRGWSFERAFVRVFGTDYNDGHLIERIGALEHNRVYMAAHQEAFGAHHDVQ